MKKTLIVITLGIIAFTNISRLLPYGTGDWVSYLLLVTIAFICYRVIKNNKNIGTNPFSRSYNNPFNTTDKKTSTQNPFAAVVHPKPYQPVNGNKNILYILAGVALIIIITPRFWGAISVYFFSVGDNLNLLYLWNPLIIWGIFGLFAGIAYGGFVSCKKYKLNLKYAVMPVLLMLTVLFLLFLNNTFLKSHTGLAQLPIVDFVKKPDLTMFVPVIKHKRRRHHKSIIYPNADSSVNSSNQNPVQSTENADNKVIEENRSKIYTSVEQLPGFEGGSAAFGTYLSENIRYPATARENGTQGRVIISFICEQDGSLTDVKVARGIGDGCDEEAVRVIKSSPRWKPGRLNGRPVRVAYSVPIAFTLSE